MCFDPRCGAAGGVPDGADRIEAAVQPLKRSQQNVAHHTDRSMHAHVATAWAAWAACSSKGKFPGWP